MHGTIAGTPGEEVDDDDQSSTDSLSRFLGDISDHEDPTYIQSCEAPHCKREVFSSCHICLKLLCYEHFEEYSDSCATHTKTHKNKKRVTIQKQNKPEDFIIEGEGKENETLLKTPRVNKFKLAKNLRDMGK